ncbi:ribonuclease HIII [Staphylococcus agnetis]|uniref:ribonuclease HIII n=1 Tax=Staphylococcus agnetis TaxID=985762 RepID=UPI0021CFB2EB|nr:ribonuclease HIII [Staphylococcus agnetis]UXU63596.1 ribonuclease HIII [Staphylococcus agnetis]
MANLVKTLSQSEIDQLMKKIKTGTSKLGPGMIAKAKYQGVTISIYQSRKVMFQGNNVDAVATALLGEAITLPTKKSISSSSMSKYNQQNCIGSDEAGSGDYFGPLTVCACYVSQAHIDILKTLGVDDSKKLNDAKIVSLAEQLVTFLPHSLLVLDNPKYNERQAMGWSQVKMKAVLHNECIKNVLKKVDNDAVDAIVIDQFAEPGVYKRYALGTIPLDERTHFETKGESKSLAIAAASIISRYAFVKHMDHLSQQMHQTILKGASSKVDLLAARLIEKHGLNQLDLITKKHFSNRNKALKLIESKHSK